MRQHLFVLGTILVLGCTSKQLVVNTDPFHDPDPRWAHIDSLADQGLYASALAATDTLLNEARAIGDQQLEFRALMNHARFNQMTGTGQPAIIAELEERAKTAAFPLAPLLHSVIAEQYWNYYQNDRWEILQRTATKDDPADMATWSQPVFMAKVIAEYRASLEPQDSLERTPTGRIGELLNYITPSPSGNFDNEKREALRLRPSLFDLLAHRALEVFTNSETRLAEPAWRFKLDDPKAFALFEDFADRKLVHRDSTSWEFQALRLYQHLAHLHIRDGHPDALVDVELKRLRFVRERSTLPRKDSLYLEALTTLRSRLPKDTCWAEVTHAMASWHVEQGAKYQRLAGDAWKWEKKTAVSLCDEAIAKFPGSFGAKNCANLKVRLHEPGLSVQCEDAMLPEAPFKIAMTFTNTPHVWLRIVKDDVEVDKPEYDNEEHLAALTKQKPLREWNSALPDDGDLNAHLAEIPADGLPFGHYALLVCDSDGFTPGTDQLVVSHFWSTRISFAERRTENKFDLLVLDRGTGAPKSGAHVTLYGEQPGSNAQVKKAESTIGQEGRSLEKLYMNNGRYTWLIEDGADRFISANGYGWWNNNEGQEDPLRTFLFTDRAIYRPGQPVMFKGIVTEMHDKSTEVKPNWKTTVEFFDVNGEKTDSLAVVTDAFGSFHGTFTAPQGALTGSMSLREAHGEQSVQVEEYKRPTFEVVFDPVAGQPKLDRQDTVTGVAKSYAGVPLDGAQVQWSVKRSARMPWWCGWMYRGGLPWGTETEVANGTSACDAQGKFKVGFLAQADQQFPRAADPTFDFSVEASVTDVNGETQSSTTNLAVGYRSIDIVLGVGESLDRSKTDSIDVHVANLNGQRVDIPMDIHVHRLQSPLQPLRNRSWETPDRFVLTREEHQQRFPQDVYSNENDPATWTNGAEVFQMLGRVPGNNKLALREARNWEVGTYVMDGSATDADGNKVQVSKVFTLFDPDVQNTGFTNDVFHSEPLKTTCEPGEKASILLSGALPATRVLMEVERGEHIVVSRWFLLNNVQQRVDLPVQEDDRGGFAVHLLCVERGRVHSQTQWVDVPWTNKELKVEWMSFRDKLQPGDNEEWRLKITGTKGEQVAAQMLGAMYDASLDHFVPHGWDMSVWPINYARLGWNRQEPFGVDVGQQIWRERVGIADAVHSYPMLNTYGLGNVRYRFRGSYGYMDGAVVGGASMSGGERLETVAYTTAVSRNANGLTAMHKNADESGKKEEAPAPPAEPTAKPDTGNQPPAVAGATTNNPQPIRSDFRETAFFFPDLLTDRDGSIVLRFKTPDALTRWKVMGLAHTKDLKIASFTRETVTQKPLMVVPNLPRFLREGDRITLTSKINLIEGQRAEGIAKLELFDPFTNASLNKAFGLQQNAQSFIASPGESAVVEWNVTVPEGVNACGVRITAQSKGGPRSDNTFADGEERVLPVLTDKVLVTESLPLWISKAGTKTFSLDKLKNNTSTTLRNQSLKLDCTPNPAWFAVQALPYLMEFPHECAEQTFSRFYANALAAHIVNERPVMKKVFEEWKKAGPESFASALEKNQELKNVLLTETPWVVNARNERESKQRIALLFDLQRMGTEEATAMKKLHDMQLPNGAWPWWSGMQESRYITEHIVAGFGHLEKLKAADTRTDGQTQQMLKNAVDWLDRDVDREYKELVRHTKKEDLEKYVPGAYEIHYLYARSFFPRWPINGATATAVEFYKSRLKTTWLGNGLQEQVMATLALDRLGDHATAAAIMKSLGERATRSEELGMYWKGFNAGYNWYEFPAETHALMIEAFHEVAKDEVAVNDLRRYLLKLKQTTDWKTTKATAEACYALLLTGSEWLDEANAPVIKVGNEIIQVDKKEAGTGAIEKSWTSAEIKPAMGDVSITSKADKPSWGALHWQYFEQMDKVAPHESPFSIRKQVMLTEQKDGTTQLVPIATSRTLKPGDKLTIRIELRIDRYVDYVHMKDLRASGLEPTETLSGYKYQGGLGYYESIRDASVNFFFDRIAPGTYVFEYPLRVTHQGEFSNGITTAMCMYAPEFSSHSEGVRVKVEE